MAPNNPRLAAQKQATAGTINSSIEAGATGQPPSVNRKKQKRRQKQAAKLAAEQSASGHGHFQNGLSHSLLEPEDSDPLLPAAADSKYNQLNGHDTAEGREEDDLFYSGEDSPLERQSHSVSDGKSWRKKQSRPGSQQAYQAAYPASGGLHPPPPPPELPTNSAVDSARKVTKDRIWNTSTAEERDNIRAFWMTLAEPERRSLVKVEKEAVLKKMKEQQKTSCSCSVCGRKRNAIEEELEVLYDAYYEELEQYANHRQLALDSGNPMMPPPAPYSSIAKAPLRHGPRVIPPQPPNPNPMAGEYKEDDQLDEEDYSEDEEEEDESLDGYYAPEVTHNPATDFFNFGKSLTVQGGILTVADDLLKNDGKKFIEMMEQLAERRMQRDEEARYAAQGMRHPLSSGHNHPPLDEGGYDEEEEDEYASEDEEDYEDDEMESMSEEQRMEEGRRMFQIFAARMFEQRVLNAYREKVAKERQEKLLEELADESRLDAQREAKKAKDAQKKKDKKKQQKAVKEEGKQKREAEKTALEAEAKALEERKLEEQRERKEAQRRKREAEKKAQEEERQKKEAEKLKKQQEAKEQQAEQERKQREQKEKEKKRKEEAKKKEREEKEAKEKEKREREAAEKREQEAKAKAAKEAQEAKEKELREKAKREELARHPVQQQSAAVPVPPLLRKTSSAIPIPPVFGPAPSSHGSPHLQIATPIIPKAPTPIRPRQTSRQDSLHSSPKSAQPLSGSSATSPSSSAQQPITSTPMSLNSSQSHTSAQQLPAQNSAPPVGPPPGMHPHPLPGMSNPPGMPGPPFPTHYTPLPPPGMQPRGPHPHDPSIYSNQPFSAPPYRGFVGSPNTIGFPPGINAGRPMGPGRGSPSDHTATQAPIGSGVATGSIHPTSHSRQASASFEPSSSVSHAQPIARPAPIGRPPNSLLQESPKPDVDDLSNHLGSSALLDDTDDALGAPSSETRQHMAPGNGRPSRLGFGASPIFSDAIGSAKNEAFPRGGWGAPPNPFGTPMMANHSSWSSAPAHWPNSNNLGNIAGPTRHARPVTIRLLVCQACKALSNNSTEGVPSGFGFHSLEAIMHQIDQIQTPMDTPPNMRELLDICETEGNAQNGGGILNIQEERSRGLCIKWIPDGPSGRMPGGPGEIGSPIVGSAMPMGGPPRGFVGSGIPAPGFQ